jgi:uncharacterized protein
MSTPVVSQHILNEIVRRLVEGMQPTQIILFGSHAHGEPDAESDIDIMVILLLVFR